VKLERSDVVMPAICVKIVYGAWWWEPFPMHPVVLCPKCWNASALVPKAGEVMLLWCRV
jgi:hypothetical protein